MSVINENGRQQGVITPRERQFTLERIHDTYPLENSRLWLCLIGAVSLSRPQKFITESEIAKITEKCKQIQEAENISVYDLVKQSGVADLKYDRFLENTCFNYDYERKGEERFNNAVQELIKVKEDGGVSGWVDMNSSENRSLESWVNWDLHHLKSSHYIWGETVFNSKTQEEEKIFYLSGRHAGKMERAIDFTLAAIIPIFPPAILNFVAGNGSTGGWEYTETIRRKYRKVFSLLASDEILKASGSFRHWEKPQVIKKKI